MNNAVFIRLLSSPIEDKGDTLQTFIKSYNNAHIAPTVFIGDPEEFKTIPNTPFSYWVSDEVKQLFVDLPAFENKMRTVRIGMKTGDDFRFLRDWWEVSPKDSGWIPYAKGGRATKYYKDLPIVVNWKNDGREVKEYVSQRMKEMFGNSNWEFWISNSQYFFRAGLTWSLRAAEFSPVALPSGCIFSVRGYAIIAPLDNLFSLLGLGTSQIFDYVFKLMLGRFEYPEFIVGVLRQLPVPNLNNESGEKLGDLASGILSIKRSLDKHNEISHIFSMPVLVRYLGNALDSGASKWKDFTNEIEQTIIEAQRRCDEISFSLYEIRESDRQVIEEMLRDQKTGIGNNTVLTNIDLNLPFEDLPNLTKDLISYALGCVFGRWDLRFILESGLLPELQNPFDNLPRCPPGALIGPDGFPATSGNIVSSAWMRARTNVVTLPKDFKEPKTISDSDYPLSIAWDGVLVDDPNHPHDIVANVRRVLQLLWEDEADDIETEACQILGVDNLREYFRDPNNGFFDFHIKRYSKSRRKAPIYWLLQSSQRNYAIWLYYHRLTPDTLFHAAREYVDPKLNLETSRLEELQSGLEALSGSQRTRRERQIADQASLVDEIKAFQKELDRVALLELKPDLNDGVILNIAPLHQLVPWKEAGKYWGQLTRGKYEWSSIAQQMRQRGIVKGRS